MSNELFQVVRVVKIIPNGKAIRKRRRRLKLSQRQIADKCEISVSYWSRIELGTVDYISVKTAKKIKRVLNRSNHE